jgi:hypothetical protein
VNSHEADKRYEACVKHHTKGVVDVAFFDDAEKAQNWLVHRWGGLPRDTTTDTDYGAAVYDTQQNRVRVFSLGATYLVK